MKKAPKKVKFCKRNWDKGSGKLYKALKEKHPDIQRKKKDCLGECKLCRTGCFVMVKKKPISASSHRGILKKLEKFMR